MKVHFLHVRKAMPDGKPSPNGGTTYAMEIDDNDHVVAVADAHCHPKDNFNKRLGRIKAEGRLKSDRYRMVFKAPLPVDGVVKSLLSGGEVSQ